MSISFTPRGVFVLIRIKFIDTNEQGLAVPQVSAESKEYYVEGFGSEVENLEIGDRVLMIGRNGEDYWNLPGFKNLILIKDSCVAVILKESK